MHDEIFKELEEYVNNLKKNNQYDNNKHIHICICVNDNKEDLLYDIISYPYLICKYMYIKDRFFTFKGKYKDIDIKIYSTNIKDKDYIFILNNLKED